MEPRRHPSNTPGDFYVENGLCLACTAPEHTAPDLISHQSEGSAGYHCFFRRQPDAVEEIERAVRAIEVSCCGALRYAGSDPAIIKRLRSKPWDDPCDQTASP